MTYSFIDMTPLVTSHRIEDVQKAFKGRYDLVYYPLKTFNELDIYYLTYGLKGMLEFK